MGIFFPDFGRIPIDISESDLGYKAELESTVECVAELIKRRSGKVCVITGAGISSHQLPTFRSKSTDCLWSTFSPSVLSKKNFYDDPDHCWIFLSNLRSLQIEKSLFPSISHYILHELLNRKLINSIITQNIDGLHNFKNDLEMIVELHGNLEGEAICETCNAKRSYDNEEILKTKKSPLCSVCGSVLRPRIALFGDVIPDKLRKKASKFISNSDVILLIGTYCTVDPVLSMVSHAKRTGAILVEINIERTTATEFVDASLVGSSDSILRGISELLMPEIDLDSVNLLDWECL